MRSVRTRPFAKISLGASSGLIQRPSGRSQNPWRCPISLLRIRDRESTRAEPRPGSELSVLADLAKRPMRNSMQASSRLRLHRGERFSARRWSTSARGTTKPVSRGWSCQRRSSQFWKPGAFEEVAGGGGDPGLKLRPQVGCRLDAPVDLFLDLGAEPRHRQVRDMHRARGGELTIRMSELTTIGIPYLLDRKAYR